MISKVRQGPDLVRRFMRPSAFGGPGKWEYEIGEPAKKFDASS